MVISRGLGRRGRDLLKESSSQSALFSPHTPSLDNFIPIPGLQLTTPEILLTSESPSRPRSCAADVDSQLLTQQPLLDDSWATLTFQVYRDPEREPLEPQGFLAVNCSLPLALDYCPTMPSCVWALSMVLNPYCGSLAQSDSCVWPSAVRGCENLQLPLSEKHVSMVPNPFSGLLPHPLCRSMLMNSRSPSCGVLLPSLYSTCLPPGE